MVGQAQPGGAVRRVGHDRGAVRGRSQESLAVDRENGDDDEVKDAAVAMYLRNGENEVHWAALEYINNNENNLL